MYLSIRKYSNVKSPDAVIGKVEKELMPMLQGLPGFISYYATKFDDGDLGSVTMFASKEHADAASEKSFAWVKQNLSEHMPAEPMVLRGDILFSSAPKNLSATA